MRCLVLLVILAGVASAGPTKSAKPAKAQPAVHDLSDKPIVVKAEPPKPKVVVVAHDGKHVTGRPKSDDRLTGLDHHLR